MFLPSRRYVDFASILRSSWGIGKYEDTRRRCRSPEQSNQTNEIVRSGYLVQSLSHLLLFVYIFHYEITKCVLPEWCGRFVILFPSPFPARIRAQVCVCVCVCECGGMEYVLNWKLLSISRPSHLPGVKEARSRPTFLFYHSQRSHRFGGGDKT